MQSPLAAAMVVTAALLLSLGQLSAALFQLQETSCGLEYQHTLTEAIELRKQCNNAAFRDCCQIKEFNPASISNAYEVFHLCTAKPLNFGVTKIYAGCDMDTDGGGWMVIMQRNNGTINFNRSFEDYEFGFGDLDGDFWYGLKNINCLTEREQLELRIEIGNGTIPSIVWVYQTFKVGSEPLYTLQISGGEGEGDTNDAMLIHNGKNFHTYDHDIGSCARDHGAGWWYFENDDDKNTCHTANLNGPFDLKTEKVGDSLSWTTTEGLDHYTHVSMKVRPKSCTPCKEFMPVS